MKKIKNIEEALSLFESNALIQNECNKSGNYVKGNKASDNMRKVVKYLLENDNINELKIFYTSNDAYVKLVAAMYLAPIDSEVCYNIMKEIKDIDKGWASFNAEYIIPQWKQVSSADVYTKILSEE